MSLLTELDAFFTEHRRCGDLAAGVDGPKPLRGDRDAADLPVRSRDVTIGVALDAVRRGAGADGGPT